MPPFEFVKEGSCKSQSFLLDTHDMGQCVQKVAGEQNAGNVCLGGAGLFTFNHEHEKCACCTNKEDALTNWEPVREQEILRLVRHEEGEEGPHIEFIGEGSCKSQKQLAQTDDMEVCATSVQDENNRGTECKGGDRMFEYNFKDGKCACCTMIDWES